MDAANVDLKGFTERFYHELCAGHLAPVLETLEYLQARDARVVRDHDAAHPRPQRSATPSSSARRLGGRAARAGRAAPLHRVPPRLEDARRAADPRRRRCAARGASPCATGCATSIRATCTTARAAPRGATSAAAVIERDWYSSRRGASLADGGVARLRHAGGRRLRAHAGLLGHSAPTRSTGGALTPSPGVPIRPPG